MFFDQYLRHSFYLFERGKITRDFPDNIDGAGRPDFPALTSRGRPIEKADCLQGRPIGNFASLQDIPGIILGGRGYLRNEIYFSTPDITLPRYWQGFIYFLCRYCFVKRPNECKLITNCYFYLHCLHLPDLCLSYQCMGHNILMGKNNIKNQLKIGYFTDSYTPYISGVVRSIQILTEELDKRGHSSFIFCPAYSERTEEQRTYRFASLPAPTNRDFVLPLPFSPRLQSTVRMLDLDIIHVHTPFLMGSLGASIAKRFNLPLVFTHHTLYHNYAHYLPLGRKMVSEIIRQWDKNFCSRCDLIIAPSQFVSELIRRSGVETPISVVPTGLPGTGNSGNTQWLREKFALGPDNKILLYVGRLGKEKNIYFLLRAMEMIANLRKDTILALVGTGPEEEGLRELVRKSNLRQYVFFTGRVSNKELQDCYAAADLFVFASQTETQGMVLGEAKFSGLPIVVLYSPCMAEMVFHGKDGFLAHTLDDFVGHVLYLLENEKVSISMGRRGKINALRFTTGTFASKMLQAYYHAMENYSRV